MTGMVLLALKPGIMHLKRKQPKAKNENLIENKGMNWLVMLILR